MSDPLPHAAPAAPPSGPGPDSLRRVLLVMVTGLLVARPVVPGEAPGLTSDLEGPGGMSLTLLWLLAGLLWASWRLWSGRGTLRLGLTELGLFVLVGLVFLSAGSASYKYPAWFIGWEWLCLVLAFFIVRQVAAGPEEQHGLLCALLASAVALSLTGLYQATVDTPRAAALEHNQSFDSLARYLASRQFNLSKTEVYQLHQRLVDRDVFATYTWPASFAAYLALLLPALIGAAVASYRGGGSRAQTVLAGLCALTAAIVLLMTHSGPAIFALLVVAVLALAWVRSGWERLGVVVGGLAILTGGTYVLLRAGGLDNAAFQAAYEDRRDVWLASWRMIEGKPWLGVGPGNFASFYPHFMAETAWEKAREPHNFALEVWANFGAFALLVLLLVLGLCFWRLLAWWSASTPVAGEAQRSPPPLPPPEPGASSTSTVGWEYYLGGMFGVLIGFVLRASRLPASDVLDEAISAGVRSLAWFAAFGLLERIAWTNRERVGSLLAGAVACLLCFLVGDGIGFPSVAGPFWVVLALALAIAAPPAQEWLNKQQVLQFAPVPILAGVALAYGLFIFVPMVTSASDTLKAGNNGAHFYQDVLQPSSKRQVKEPVSYIHKEIIGPLEAADRDSPGNVNTHRKLARWWAELWALTTSEQGAQLRALQWMERAQQTSPEDQQVYLDTYELRMQLRRATLFIATRMEMQAQKAEEKALEARAKKDKKTEATSMAQARELYLRSAAPTQHAWQHRDAAIGELRKAIALGPTDAPLHYHLARLLNETGDGKGAQKEAREAIRLNRLSRHPLRKLTDQQREQALRWATGEGAEKDEIMLARRRREE